MKTLAITLALLFSVVVFGGVDIATESYPAASKLSCDSQIAAVNDIGQTEIVCADKWEKGAAHNVSKKAANKFEQDQLDLKWKFATDGLIESFGYNLRQPGDYATPYRQKAFTVFKPGYRIVLFGVIIAIPALLIFAGVSNKRRCAEAIRTFYRDYELPDGTLLGTIGDRGKFGGWQYAIQSTNGNIKVVPTRHLVVDFMTCIGGKFPLYLADLDEGKPWIQRYLDPARAID